MLGLHDPLDLSHELRVLVCDISLLRGIFDKIIEFQRTTDRNY